LSQEPSIPGWTPTAGIIEVQNSVPGASSDGLQHVEIKPDMPIQQVVPTKSGQFYQVRFAFSHRINAADNLIEIRWDGNLLDHLSADGSGTTVTDWLYFTYIVTASSNVTILEFRDVSDPGDSLGALLDDVSVIRPVCDNTCKVLRYYPVGIPALNKWGLMVFMILAGIIAVYYLNRKKREVAKM
jgi:hypothetical protein